MSQSRRESTTFLTKEEVLKKGRKWFLFDATGKTLGRFASEVTKVLRGKHRPTFTPHIDSGDGVIVINAGKIVVTGLKEAQKSYTYYTGSMSGLRRIPYREARSKNPGFIIQHAVKGMMPKTKLANAQLKRLRVFAGAEHKMEAQQPIVVSA